jgi:hypothetical protein
VLVSQAEAAVQASSIPTLEPVAASTSAPSTTSVAAPLPAAAAAAGAPVYPFSVSAPQASSMQPSSFAPIFTPAATTSAPSFPSSFTPATATTFQPSPASTAAPAMPISHFLHTPAQPVSEPVAMSSVDSSAGAGGGVRGRAAAAVAEGEEDAATQARLQREQWEANEAKAMAAREKLRYVSKAGT